MWKPAARSIDWLLSMMLKRFVRLRGGVPTPKFVPQSPDAVEWPRHVEIAFEPAGEDFRKLSEEHDGPLREFSFASPVDSLWEESQTVRGLAIGPEDAARVMILLHGAYEDRYLHPVWMARPYTEHGYRVLIPAGPCHLQRTPGKLFSGTPIFWSAELVVAALHQWLAEIRAMMGYLRRQGVEQVALFGYSLGSMVAGLAATLWDDVDSIALLSPVGSHAGAIEHSRVAARIWPWMRNLSLEATALLDRWAPIERKPLIERMAFFITLHDKLQPAALQEQWWQAWGQPPRWDYAHAHLSVHYSNPFYRDLAEFAGEMVAGTAERGTANER